MTEEEIKNFLARIPRGRFETLVENLNSYARKIDREEFGLPVYMDLPLKEMSEIVEEYVKELLLDYGEKK